MCCSVNFHQYAVRFHQIEYQQDVLSVVLNFMHELSELMNFTPIATYSCSRLYVVVFA